MSKWQWAHDVFDATFAGLRGAGYRLERTNRERYWEVHEAEMRQHFPPEVFFDTTRLRTDAQIAGQERLAETMDDGRLTDFTLVYSGDALAAQFCGEQKTERRYRMWHSHVHPSFRRRGLYGQIVRSTVRYTGELGFDTVGSEHAPGNTAILIAKLKVGFRISGFDVTPEVGTSVHLTYFHNPDLLAAYEFRCGLATLNDRVVAASRGAWLQLASDRDRG